MRQVFVDRTSDAAKRRGLFSAAASLSSTPGPVVASAVRSRKARSAHRAPSTLGELGLPQSLLLALTSLVLVGAVAFTSMLGSTAVFHLLMPYRRFDAFHALHEPVVVGILLALCVLWLPPVSVGDECGTRAPSSSTERSRVMAAVYPQVLRFWQAGPSRSAWPHQREATLLPGSTREPRSAFGSLGDVMIHRSSLVAGPVGSEWRNQRPHPVINTTQRD
jgi:hypothetical protein